MAEIPVEKKSGIPWWVWLILAVLVALLLFWILGGDDDEDLTHVESDRIEIESTDSAPVGTDGAAITTLSTLTGASSLAALVGDDVDLDGVPVESLAGDMAFWVGDGPDDRVFVAFDQEPTPDLAKEGEVDVNPGSRVDIDGVLRSVSNPDPDGVNFEAPPDADYYIHATSIDVLD